MKFETCVSEKKTTLISNMTAAALRRLVPERMRPIGYLTHLVQRRTQNRVCKGPFAGMRYIEGSIGSAYLPKLLGTYEQELATIIEEVCKQHFDRSVILGAAEGYYAVGLALRNPQSRVLAFESKPSGRVALRRMTQLNGVTPRVEIRGRCDVPGLRAAIESGKKMDRPRAFILCDVEGDEKRLLDPFAVPPLRSAHLLVETHEFVSPGVTQELRRRFLSSHQIQLITQQPRSGEAFPFQTIGTRILPRAYLDWAVSEWRPEPMSWLWMTPHA